MVHRITDWLGVNNRPRCLSSVGPGVHGATCIWSFSDTSGRCVVARRPRGPRASPLRCISRYTSHNYVGLGNSGKLLSLRPYQPIIHTACRPHSPPPESGSIFSSQRGRALLVLLGVDPKLQVHRPVSERGHTADDSNPFLDYIGASRSQSFSALLFRDGLLTKGNAAQRGVVPPLLLVYFPILPPSVASPSVPLPPLCLVPPRSRTPESSLLPSIRESSRCRPSPPQENGVGGQLG